jgi:hypothetical protein
MQALTSFSKVQASIALTLVSIALSACASAVGEPGAVSDRVGRYGVTASTPEGWHHVPARGLPGAKIPLQIASFAPRGAVRTICRPGALIAQIPPGQAVVQILDDRGFKNLTGGQPGAVSSGPLSTYPPLHRPFHLGRPQGFECGESFNVFFRRAGRALHLRVWTGPAGPSAAIRRQIEAMMDSLRVRHRP